MTSPVETLSPLFYVEARMSAGSTLSLPNEHEERALYIVEGAVAFGLYLGIKVIRRQLFLRELRIARISPEELEARLRANEPVFIVDLRHELEVEDQPMMIRGAMRITPAALEQGRITIPRDREVVLYCS
jgi:redox-sensitive bicupin YhaK (pirin superfamily)